MTDEQFAEFCSEHPDLFVEMTADRELLVMPPNDSITGLRNSEVDTQLRNWARQDGKGFANDSSTGYVLPCGARRSPDASWTLKSRVRQLSPESREGYWHLCPDFVIELTSPTDRLKAVQAKMREWVENGAELGWLIDADRRTVHIYRSGQEPEETVAINSLGADGPVHGFRLD